MSHSGRGSRASSLIVACLSTLGAWSWSCSSFQRTSFDEGVGVPRGECLARAPVDLLLAVDGGRHVPDSVRRFFARYGGASFSQGIFFYDSRARKDAMFGWFMDATEMIEAFNDTRGVLPDDVVPIANDGADNHVSVGVGPANAGVVYFHVHDAPLDDNLYVLAGSFQQFLRSLHPEA